MTLLPSVTDSRLATLLVEGAVGVMPTDTLYGVVCLASNQAATERLHRIKQRDGKPGTVIATSVDQLVELGLKRRYLTVVQNYWPGAVSVIIPCGPELAHLHLGKGGVAVRIPDQTDLLELLAKTGPLLTSSANLTGQLPAATVAAAQEYLGDTVDFYVEGGDLSGRKPSTIIRVVDDAIEVVRTGAVHIEEANEKGNHDI
ncbi:MAG TPA: L-threonylcarbamoyladenylate synthase [Candidatus Limnocylindrales bacterium]|nr:L-threonylcarbamoyladenylate synthase [Candidatus Limnocylindrales bacterium]